MSNTRSRNKSVKTPSSGSVVEISEAFKKQMATTEGNKKGKVKNSIKTTKEKDENLSIDGKQSVINTETDENNGMQSTQAAQSQQNYAGDKHDNTKAKGENAKGLLTQQQEHDDCNRPLNGNEINSKVDSSHIENQTVEEVDESLAEQESQEESQEEINVSNAEVVESLREVCELIKKLDNDIHHPKNGIGAKLVQMTLRMDNLYTDIHGAVEGILPRVNEMSAKISVHEENQKKVIQLMGDMKKLSRDVDLMKDLFQKHSSKLQGLEKSVLDLTRRGMEQNLVFHGVTEFQSENPREKEDCKEVVVDFL